MVSDLLIGDLKAQRLGVEFFRHLQIVEIKFDTYKLHLDSIRKNLPALGIVPQQHCLAEALTRISENWDGLG